MFRQLLPLASQDDVSGIESAVNCQNTVEMIDLVLEQFRYPAFGVHHAFFSFFIPILDVNRNVALNFHHDIGKGEAVIPQRHHLPGAAHNLRVDQWQRLIDLNNYDAKPTPDLRRGNSSPESIPLTKVGERFLQIGNCRTNIGIGKIADRLGGLAQARVSEKEYFPHSHESAHRWLNICTVDTIEQPEHCLRRTVGRIQHILTFLLGYGVFGKYFPLVARMIDIGFFMYRKE